MSYTVVGLDIRLYLALKQLNRIEEEERTSNRLISSAVLETFTKRRLLSSV